jgi:hypothetical protein
LHSIYKTGPFFFSQSVYNNEVVNINEDELAILRKAGKITIKTEDSKIILISDYSREVRCISNITTTKGIFVNVDESGISYAIDLKVLREDLYSYDTNKHNSRSKNGGRVSQNQGEGYSNQEE